MPPRPEIDQRVLARATQLRLTLEMARRRARMYLADPASDNAISAEQALVEVLGLLEGAPTDEPFDVIDLREERAS